MKKEQMKKIAEHIVYFLTIRDWDNLEDLKGSYKDYTTIAEDVQNGEYLIWFDDCREFLKDLYEETEEQANKFSNEEVWNKYKHCLASMANHQRYLDELLNI